MKLIVNIEYSFPRILRKLTAIGLLAIATFGTSNLEAQDMDMEQNLLMLNVGGGAGMPGGDLADRFGWYGKAGGGLTYRFGNNWYTSATLDFHFGSNVKEDDLLASIMTQGQLLIGSDGALYQPEAQMRSWQMMAWGGKLFPFSKDNRKTGLLTLVGAGFLQHHINYFVEQSDNLPQITGDYEQGYDRMTHGFSVAEYIGYHHMSDNRLINFNIGIEMVQGFTSNSRGIDYGTATEVDDSRLDLMFNLKASWILPFYRRGQVEMPDEPIQPDF